MSWLKQIQNINQLDKDTVLGYTRAVERIIDSGIIIKSVSYLCLLYYSDGDCFNECGDGMEIHNTKDAVTAINPGDNYFGEGKAYGSMNIDINDECHKINPKITYEWTFKIMHRTVFDEAMLFGIQNMTSCYAGRMYDLRANNTVKMKLVMNESTLKFYVNDKKELYHVIQDIPLDKNVYNMMIDVGDKGTIVKLMKFDKYSSV